jgi:hypothetical protein
VSHGVCFHHLRRLTLAKRSYTNEESLKGSSAELSIEAFNDQKGLELVENAAKTKMVGSTVCWQHAYQHLYAGCSEILYEKLSKFA